MKIVIGFLGTIFFLELDILDESRKERGVLLQFLPSKRRLLSSV
jgi:hypothetical protein